MDNNELALPSAALAPSGLSPEDGSQAKQPAANAEWRDGADLSAVKWPLGAYAPGNYMTKCRGCGDTVINIAKRGSHCLICAIEGLRRRAEVMESALRVRIWNEATARGICQHDAIAKVAAEIERIVTTTTPTQEN